MPRNVIVTGAASGIGFETAKQFVELGDRVFMTDWKAENLKKAYDELKQTAKDDMLHGRTADVSKEEEVAALAELVDSYGGADVLANCAGVYRVGPAHESTMDDYDYQFDINVRGIFNTCKAFVPSMLKKKKGAIVNVSSVSGMGGDYNMALYCASKGAVIAFSKAMAMDYSMHGIRVNIVSPSAVKTPMFLGGATQEVLESFRQNMPARALCEPEWCANVIGYLASDQAVHLCGVNIPVDGGLSAWNGQPHQQKSDIK